MAESKVKEAKQTYKQTTEAVEDAAINMQSKGEQLYENNKQTINGVLVAVVVIIGGYFAYNHFVKKPKIAEANEISWKAQGMFEKDSFAIALNGGNGVIGFDEIASDFSGTPVGNLAHYYAGICALHLGKFQDAIDYLEDYSTDDPNLKSISIGAIGDAYSELKEFDNAINHYKEAADVNNNFTAPIYLMKAGQLLEINTDYSAANDIYKSIKSKYGKSEEGRMIDKFIARTEALATK